MYQMTHRALSSAPPGAQDSVVTPVRWELRKAS